MTPPTPPNIFPNIFLALILLDTYLSKRVLNIQCVHTRRVYSHCRFTFYKKLEPALLDLWMGEKQLMNNSENKNKNKKTIIEFCILMSCFWQ